MDRGKLKLEPPDFLRHLTYLHRFHEKKMLFSMKRSFREDKKFSICMNFSKPILDRLFGWPIMKSEMFKNNFFNFFLFQVNFQSCYLGHPMIHLKKKIFLNTLFHAVYPSVENFYPRPLFK